MEEDIRIIERALALSSSMINSGESHSNASLEMKAEADKAIHRLKLKEKATVTEEDIHRLIIVKNLSTDMEVKNYLGHLLVRLKVLSRQ